MLSLYPGSVPSSLGELPSGEGATRATLRHMVDLVKEYKKDVGIGTLARQLIGGTLGATNTKDYSGYVRALQHFVRDNIRYVPDVEGVEMLQTPVRTLQIRTGDCDDKSVLLASLLASIGLATRFIALAFNNGPFSHVLTQVRLGTSWIPLETIIDGAEPGWFPDNPAPSAYMLAHVSR